MSFQLICDICGKDSGKGQAIFNMGAIELVVENFRGEEFNVFVNMEIKDKRDYDFVEGLKIKSAKELDKLAHDDDMVLHTPDPHVCIVCQRELASRVLREGVIDKDDNYTQLSKVALKSFTLPLEKQEELDEFYRQEFDDYDEFDDDDDEDDEDFIDAEDDEEENED